MEHKSKNRHPWYKLRGYLHFDPPVSIKLAESIVMHPLKVKAHSFYPFISYDIKTKKIYKNKLTNVIEEKEKIRSISYASHLDSQIYSYYRYLLNIEYEKIIKENNIENNVLAFRKLNKCNIDYANDAYNNIEKRKYCFVIALDISGFFDNLDHQILKKNWCKVLGTKLLPNDHYNIYKSVTKFSKVNKDELFNLFNIPKTIPKNNHIRICKPQEFREIVRKNNLIKINFNKGIPQGSPISALLSNIYMIDFDISFKKYMDKIEGSYYRYCDDSVPRAQRPAA